MLKLRFLKELPVHGAPHLLAIFMPTTAIKGSTNVKYVIAFSANKIAFLKEAVMKCPHCMKTLERIKERKDFLVHKCKNNYCSYYTDKLKRITKEEKTRFKQDPQSFKVRYIYRKFELDFDPLAVESPVKPDVNLSRIHSSPNTLGLILTYHVNYGLPARKTAALMYDIHQVKISALTILNCANSDALLTKPFIDHYPYELSNSFCGDETYNRFWFPSWIYISCDPFYSVFQLFKTTCISLKIRCL